MILLNKVFVLAALVILPKIIFTQELYVYTEPASNMPAKSISFKGTATFVPSHDNSFLYQRYSPEIMMGINKKLMVHVAGSFSDFYSPKVRPESIRTYVKYRFLSNDDVHRHFRMAAYAEGSYTQSPYLYEEMSLEGDNSGILAGLIATQLVNKLAISSTVGYMRAFRDADNHLEHFNHSRNMLNYSLSAGYLVLPKNYENFHQTNFNVYLELLGAKSLDKSEYNLDIAPAIQFIFNSTTKLNLGARFQAGGNMDRIGGNRYLISIEQTLLNVLK